MRRRPVPGKHYRRLDHDCILNSMTSAATLSAEPTGQWLKLGLIRLPQTSVALGDAVPKPLGFVALCQKHGRGEGDVSQRQRRPCPWTVAALGLLAGRAGSQTPRRTAALRAEGIAFGVPTCPPRRRMEYVRDRDSRKETSPSRRQVGGQMGYGGGLGRSVSGWQRQAQSSKLADGFLESARPSANEFAAATRSRRKIVLGISRPRGPHLSTGCRHWIPAAPAKRED